LSRLRSDVLLWLCRVPTKPRPILCYDYEGDFDLLMDLLDGLLPKRWKQEMCTNALTLKKPRHTTPSTVANTTPCMMHARTVQPTSKPMRNQVFGIIHALVTPPLSRSLIKLAQLGGYLARASDPPPGNTVIWRGLRRLVDIQVGFKLANCG
jgi:hypothetical protein